MEYPSRRALCEVLLLTWVVVVCVRGLLSTQVRELIQECWAGQCRGEVIRPSFVSIRDRLNAILALGEEGVNQMMQEQVEEARETALEGDVAEGQPVEEEEKEEKEDGGADSTVQEGGNSVNGQPTLQGAQEASSTSDEQ